MTASNPRTQVVLLGASNLVLGWKQMTRQLRTAVTGPMDVYVACGMGRSYVSWSRFGARRLPSIQDCGIWDQLAATARTKGHSQVLGEATADMPVQVLVTDVGNDLVYGRTPEETVTAVDKSLSRIVDCFPHSKILVTELPLDSVINLGSFRFHITRSLLFAGCRLTLPQLKTLAIELNERLVKLCRNYGVASVKPRAEWYGLDPIHVLPRCRDAAFATYFGAWRTDDGPLGEIIESAAVSQLPRPTPELRQVWGKDRFVAQPSVSTPQIQVFGY